MLTLGDLIPDFSLANENGEMVNLRSLLGSYTVLYTYPKNNTPGCTTEACSFRDFSAEITQAGAKIFGISGDSVTSHANFKAKHNLNFTLLSDPEHKVIQALGAWGEKISFGKKRIGIIRQTFLFDPQGRLIQIWPKVSPREHGAEIAAYLKSL